MKKIIILLSVLAISSNLSAQLYINEQGNIGVCSSATSNSSMRIANNNKEKGLDITGYGSSDIYITSNYNTLDSLASIKYGINIFSVLKRNKTNYGIKVRGFSFTDKSNIGIISTGGNSSLLSFGVVGNLNGASIQTGAGIYGSSGNNSSIESNYSGKYAGYFHGDVRVTGALYANVLTPSSTSNLPDTQNGINSVIQVVSHDADEMGENVSDKLRQVQLLKIQTPEYSTSSNNDNQLNKFVKPVEIESIERALLTGDELTSEQLRTLESYEETQNMTNADVPQTHLSSVRYSLAADQLQNVYPELVYEDQNGNVSINYIEMIPLLVQSINELQDRVDVLEEENISLRSTNGHSPSRKKGRKTDKTTNESNTDIISLGQNIPNPFTDRTAIAVNVPKSVRSAALFIYDMGGKQTSRIEITDRGKSSVSVSGTGLQEGMYLYSLIVDGQVIDTRKMILTK